MAEEPICSALERLFDLLAALQQPQIGGGLVALVAMPARTSSTCDVDLARVGLAGDGVARGEAHLLGHQLVEPADFGVVAAEQFQEAGLRAGGALRAAGLQLRNAMLELLQVHAQVVGPQAGPLADRGRLGRLEVREAQAGQVAVLLGERRPARR